MQLKNGHIVIPANIAQDVLLGEEQVNVAYYPERQQFLFAAKSKTFFEKLHSAQWMRLKEKNLSGDKTLFVRGILLDNDLDDSDRELPFEIKSTGIVTVILA